MVGVGAIFSTSMPRVRQTNQHMALISLPLSKIFHHIVSLVVVKYWQPQVTYCGVIGCHVEKDFRGTSAGNISVAVPHAGYHVGLEEIQCQKSHFRQS